jgi:hypothetical protein
MPSVTIEREAGARFSAESGSLADVTEASYETSSDVAAMLSKFMGMSRILSFSFVALQIHLKRVTHDYSDASV